MQFSFKDILKRFAKRLWLNFKLKLILRIIAYLAYILLGIITIIIDHFVIKSDVLWGFFNFKTILKIIVLP